MRRLSALPVILTLLVAACSSGGVAPSGTPSVSAASVTFDGTSATLTVQIADTDAERHEGLSGRSSLPADTGMVFVWDQPVETTFWMKDTLLPLSIAFVAEDGRILAIHEMHPCEADPCPTFGAPAPFSAAVEAPAGWFEANGIAVGGVATMTPSLW
ncbi:MAG: DUF192 domain-containing protein [Actinomycetota bacterium]